MICLLPEISLPRLRSNRPREWRFLAPGLHRGIRAPRVFRRTARLEVGMDWMQELGGVLGRYEGATASNPPESAHEDFDQVARAAPKTDLAQGLAAAFRSDQTPPF